jgi:short-subunit dehydrogenase
MADLNQKIAVVTGASSGIGAEIVRHLKNEINLEIWLVARRKDRLEALSQELNALGATTICVVLDLQNPDSWKSLEESILNSGKRVAWLVNNAGFGYSGLFENQTLESIESMAQLNMVALTSITRRMLPFMDKGAHILNVASAISFAPVAGYAVYAATKAYVLAFSLSLRAELRDREISVSTLCPGPVATEFFDYAAMDAPPTFLIEKAANTAFLAVEKSTQRKAIIVTGLAAWTLRIIAAILPRAWVSHLSRMTLKGAKFKRQIL